MTNSSSALLLTITDESERMNEFVIFFFYFRGLKFEFLLFEDKFVSPLHI